MAVSGVDVALHAFSCVFVGVGSLLTQGVHATVHVGIYATIAVGYAVYYTLRMLRCCGIIEVYQRLTVYLAI